MGMYLTQLEEVFGCCRHSHIHWVYDPGGEATDPDALTPDGGGRGDLATHPRVG